MKKLILVLFVLVISQNVFAQWTLMNRASILNSINKLSSNNFLIFCTDSYIKSTDAGQTWTLPKTIGYSTVENAQFVDTLYGWAISDSYYRKLIKTTDGGNSWTLLTSPFSQGIGSIFFLDRLNGWVTGRGGQVMRTTNGGINWTGITYPQLGNIYGIFMKDNHNGYLFDYTQFTTDTVMKTTNGGVTWFKSKLATSHFSIQIQFTDSLTGYSLGWYDNIAKTTNGGLNWSTIITPFDGNYVKMFFLNSTLGWILETHGQIWKTTNGGVNWTNQRLTSGYNAGPELLLHDILFKDANTGWASGEQGKLLMTTNGGTNWNYLLNPPAPYVSSLYFKDINTGYSLSKYISYVNDTNVSSIWKTTNKGISWNSLYRFSNRNLYSMSVVDSDIYLCGGAGDYFKTTNGGINWNNYPISNKTLNSIFFLNQNTGWICGDSGLVLKTTNAGLIWDALPFFNDNLLKIDFKNLLTGFIMTPNFISATTDGGQNWITNTIGSGHRCSDFYMLNSNTGFVVANKYGSSGGYPTYFRILAKTTDGGITWINKINESGVGSSEKNFNNIIFSDSANGYLSHNNGLKRTFNGGETWSDDTSLPIKLPMGIGYFINSNQGYLVSTGGTLFSNSLQVGINYFETETKVNNFSLHQNHPNPFNPSTRIKYELQISNYVTLKVFDLLGKEVAILVNEKQNAGSYAVDFNSTEFNLPSGIYFYTLNAGEFKETKKMVLLK